MGSLNNAITHKNSLTKHFSSFISSKNFYFQYIRQYLLILQKKCVLRNQLLLNYYNTAQKNTEPHQQFCVKISYSTFPSNARRFFRSVIKLSNSVQSSDWAPSHFALHGLLCTSINNPSAPAAMAALAMVGTIHA